MLDYTTPIKKLVAKYGVDYSLPLPDEDFPHLTWVERQEMQSSLPTDTDLMLGWALPVLALTGPERKVMVAAQIEVLTGRYEDPVAWCVAAIRLTEGMQHG